MFAKTEKPKGAPSVPDMQPTTSYRAETPAPSHTTHKVTPSIISADLKITGDLQSDGDIHVDGLVEGDIYAKSVTIGDSAKVNGKINGERVRICGSLSGGVDAAMVELTRTARVEGDIVHGSLQIEAGGCLEGQLRRRPPQAGDNITPIANSRDSQPAAAAEESVAAVEEDSPKAAQAGLH